jgi:hypothetical protein
MPKVFLISLLMIATLVSAAIMFYAVNISLFADGYAPAVTDLNSMNIDALDKTSSTLEEWGGPFNSHTDTTITKDGELARSHIVSKMSYTGDYETGYFITYLDRKQIISLTRSDGSVYFEEKPLLDRTKAIVYSEEQKSWIELAISNAGVQRKLGEISGSNMFIDAGDNTTIQSEKFGCPGGGCSYISFYTENFASHLGVTVNTSSMKVVEIQDWSSR